MALNTKYRLRYKTYRLLFLLLVGCWLSAIVLFLLKGNRDLVTFEESGQFPPRDKKRYDVHSRNIWDKDDQGSKHVKNMAMGRDEQNQDVLQPNVLQQETFLNIDQQVQGHEEIEKHQYKQQQDPPKIETPLQQAPFEILEVQKDEYQAEEQEEYSQDEVIINSEESQGQQDGSNERIREQQSPEELSEQQQGEINNLNNQREHQLQQEEQVHQLQQPREQDVLEPSSEPVEQQQLPQQLKNPQVNQETVPPAENNPQGIHQVARPDSNWPHVQLEPLLGENNAPVKINITELSVPQKAAYDEGIERHSFNRYASDMISVRRTLPDLRDPICADLRYPTDLPDTSVIIIFANEAWSTLLRTVHSVLDRSPGHLLKEVVLVDDYSDMDKFGHLGAPLASYLSQYNKVKLYRTPQRAGLMRARLLGAEKAQGSVLTFLDAHCEVLEGWLEPLLSRIFESPKHVVVPNIPSISDETFEIMESPDRHCDQYMLGGFSWGMIFNWHPIPDRLKRNRTAEQRCDPVSSPTMAGGLFSIDRDYFYHIGSYDAGMEFWGGENLEMSFRIWMCGGTVELVPCSLAAHVFRKKNPIASSNPKLFASVGRNLLRVSEVWMDDYKQLYYSKAGLHPDKGSYGDVRDRLALREKLQCQDFAWYLKNVYPEQFIPDQAIRAGKLQSLTEPDQRPRCVGFHNSNKDSHLVVELCTNRTSELYMASSGEFRALDNCLEYRAQSDEVVFFDCHGLKGNQFWDIKGQQVRHVDTKRCLAVTSLGKPPSMEWCSDDIRQLWDWR